MAGAATIILGSKSDAPIAERATKILTDFGVDFEVVICSAHRAPDDLRDIVKKNEAKGTKVFIAIAGLSAALPGVIAAHTAKPVIGVPVSGKLNLDSILSMVQMPAGVPVATVGLDNGENGALLAIEILALEKDSLQQKLKDYKEMLSKKGVERNPER